MPFTGACFCCGQVGHLRVQCPHLPVTTRQNTARVQLGSSLLCKQYPTSENLKKKSQFDNRSFPRQSDVSTQVSPDVFQDGAIDRRRPATGDPSWERSIAVHSQSHFVRPPRHQQLQDSNGAMRPVISSNTMGRDFRVQMDSPLGLQMVARQSALPPELDQPISAALSYKGGQEPESIALNKEKPVFIKDTTTVVRSDRNRAQYYTFHDHSEQDSEVKEHNSKKDASDGNRIGQQIGKEEIKQAFRIGKKGSAKKKKKRILKQSKKCANKKKRKGVSSMHPGTHDKKNISATEMWSWCKVYGLLSDLMIKLSAGYCAHCYQVLKH